MDPTMRITILKDNQTARPDLAPGHGLAMLVEAGGRRVLFDTGPDQTIIDNAAALGVSLRPLDAIVLSHGHYDHTGGLSAVLTVTGPVKVVAHRAIFDRTFSGAAPGGLRYIGIPMRPDDYEALGARFAFGSLPAPLGDMLLTTGKVPPLHLAPEQRAGLWRNEGTVPQPDDFRDDCSLVARLPECSAVLTGCAHAGLVSILCKAQTIVPDRPPRVLVGGLHLGAASDDAVVSLAREVAGMGVRIILPCHCTGARATEVLTDRFPGEVLPIGAGSTIHVHEDGDCEVRHPVGSGSGIA